MKIFITSLAAFGIMMILKLSQAVAWPWVVITAPLWAGVGTEVACVVIAAVIVIKEKGDANGK